MGDLGQDTAVRRVDHGEEAGAGRFHGSVSAEWEIWGPMGGYLAGIGLRAAGEHCDRARPASLSGHFLGGIGNGPVSVRTETVRTTRVATSTMVTIEQEGRVGFRALVWGVDEIDGLEHQTARRPEPASAPEATASLDERTADDENRTRHAFWDNLDCRPLNWIDDWDGDGPHEPASDGWYRFRPTAAFAEPWIDAVRLLVIVDLDGWPAAHRAHPLDAPYFAPTIEVSARFVDDVSSEPWLRSIAEAPVAANGLVAHRAEVWTPGGALVASGGSTLLSRPAARRPD